MSRMATRLWPPPWYALGRTHARSAPIVELRRAYRELYWSNIPLWKMPLTPIAAILWPPVILATSLFRDLPRHGARAKAASGRGYVGQVIDHLAIGLQCNLWPHQYYAYELFRPELRGRGHEYLRRIETKRALYKLLRADHSEEDRFRDKVRFFLACERAGIRSVPVLLALKDGRVDFPSGRVPALPAADLFIKPRIGRGGKGAAIVRRAGAHHRYKGRDLASPQDLVATLTRHSGDAALIVQPRLSPHPTLRDISLNALTTVRVVTATNEQGRGEFIAAAFRVPSAADTIVDNFHAGGLAAAVDARTGALGSATGLGTHRATSWHSRHPVTGAQIEGRILPCWPDLVRLAEDAHTAMADRAVLGWDIAILADGPCIIEANSFPDLNILQRSMLQPLGNGRLGHLMRHHLRNIHPAL